MIKNGFKHDYLLFLKIFKKRVGITIIQSKRMGDEIIEYIDVNEESSSSKKIDKNRCPICRDDTPKTKVYCQCSSGYHESCIIDSLKHNQLAQCSVCKTDFSVQYEYIGCSTEDVDFMNLNFNIKDMNIIAFAIVVFSIIIIVLLSRIKKNSDNHELDPSFIYMSIASFIMFVTIVVLYRIFIAYEKAKQTDSLSIKISIKEKK